MREKVNDFCLIKDWGKWYQFGCTGKVKLSNYDLSKIKTVGKMGEYRIETLIHVR